MKYPALALTASVLALNPSPLFAQSVDAKSGEGPAAAEGRPADAGGIEQIIVTAEKRSARMQDVPIAITALTSTQLRSQGVVDAFALGKVTPGYNSNRQVGFGTPFIRGVGSVNVTAGNEPSVATYIDGFYQGVSYTAQLPFNNIERIEVLKGPQGTLYGRNATGGLINIVTRAPQQSFAAEGNIGYGNYQTLTADAYVTGGLSETIAADIAFTHRNQDKGFSTNLVDGKRYGSQSYDAVRARLKIDFGDNNSLLLGAEYSEAEDNRANVNNPATGTVPLLAGPGVLYGQSRSVFASNITPRFDVTQYAATADLRLDLGFGQFVSLTQYRESKSRNIVEGDGTSADGVFFTTQNDINGVAQPVAPASFSYDSIQKNPYFFTQEVQLLSKSGGPLDWIVGAFYQASKEEYDPLALTYQIGIRPLASYTSDQTTRALAGFAQGSYKFSDSFSLTAGVRYSTEQKRAGGGLDALVAPPATFVDLTKDYRKRFNSFTYHAAASYRVNPDLMVYASASKGFKSGVYDPTDFSGRPPARPETLYAYEAGFKADPSRVIRLNGAAYYYNYKDLQVFINSPQGLGILQNAANAEMYGAELELDVKPTSALDLRAALGLEHSRYKNFTGAAVYFPSTSGGNYPATIDASGRQLQRAPEITGSVSGSYRFDLGTSGSLTLNSSVAYTSKFYWDAANAFKQGAYALVDASARFETADGKWSLTLWGKNLTNKEYVVYLNPQQRFTAVGYGDPATYGVTFGAKF